MCVQNIIHIIINDRNIILNMLEINRRRFEKIGYSYAHMICVAGYTFVIRQISGKMQFLVCKFKDYILSYK